VRLDLDYSPQYTFSPCKGPSTGWLLYNDVASKVTKAILAKLTNGDYLGGTKIVRGYTEVEKILNPDKKKKVPKPTDNMDQDKGKAKVGDDQDAQKQSCGEAVEPMDINDYKVEEDENLEITDRENSAKHLILVVHG
jgi:hypothetical protein